MVIPTQEYGRSDRVLPWAPPGRPGAGAGSKRSFGQPEPLEQAALPGGRGRAEKRESLACHWPGPWVWRLCSCCGGSSPRRKMRFEEQPLRMNLFSPAFFPSVLRFYAGNLQTAEKPRERGQTGGWHWSNAHRARHGLALTSPYGTSSTASIEKSDGRTSGLTPFM